MKRCDFLVIGSGIAGLLSAIKVATANSQAAVAVITKSDSTTTNTRMAQGGIAVTLNGTSEKLEQHIQDTLRAGAGLCNESIVRQVVGEGASCLQELIDWGVRFDRSDLQMYDLAREGGHSTSRILHHKDKTGEEIHRVLLNKVKSLPNLQLFNHHLALDLIIEKGPNENVCHGANALCIKSKQIFSFFASSTILGTGGIGQVYPCTTNPVIATGDGIALAYRAGAQISGMEFIQFHPTALFSGAMENPAFLISEAVRGFGAYLLNSRHERFMSRYDELGELACRDRVALAIEKEMLKTENDFVYLDCRHLEKTSFKRHFPNIVNELAKRGIDFATDLIPVMPAMHYLCGGINVDSHGKTSIENLLACGECANTGMHGANRLASNSLLEAMVFAHHCAHEALGFLNRSSCRTQQYKVTMSLRHKRKVENLVFIQNRKHTIQSIIGRYAGILRDNIQLSYALANLDNLQKEIKRYYQTHEITLASSELRNLAIVAKLIVQQSIERKENIGAFCKEGVEGVV